MRVGVGGAETSAFPDQLSATVEGEFSTSQLRCGVARSPTARGKEGLMISGTLGMVRRMKKEGILEPSASMGRRST